MVLVPDSDEVFGTSPTGGTAPLLCCRCGPFSTAEESFYRCVMVSQSHVVL